MKTDEEWMAEALALAREGEGLTRPNPPVGAVVIKNGERIGSGHHKKAGGPHAEVNALRDAGSAARGATLHVTLEPCSSFGRTPPCTDAILRAGIHRVVVGCPDPNPEHAGRGLTLLRDRGIDVRSGVLRNEAEALIEPFATRLLRGRPFVTLKMAMTLDGRIADESHESKWITGPAARDHVQDLRRRADAILVGANTVLYDNPSLLPRPRNGRAPFRVVLDRRRRVPADSAIFTDAQSKQTLHYTDPEQALPDIFADLAKRHHVMHLLCEGGGQLAASLAHAKLVDEYHFFIAPKFLGAYGIPVLGGPGWPLADAPPLTFLRHAKFGDDLLIIARPQK